MLLAACHLWLLVRKRGLASWELDSCERHGGLGDILLVLLVLIASGCDTKLDSYLQKKENQSCLCSLPTRPSLDSETANSGS